jgi:hypothetical protein
MIDRTLYFGRRAAPGTLIKLHGEMIADFYGGAELGWDSFRVGDKPFVSPLPKEIAAFLLDCRYISGVSLQAKQLERPRNIPPAVCQS